jgi:tetratricopeptide (TPR) repeat protein
LYQELMQRLDGVGISGAATVNLPVHYWSRREFVRAESLFRKYPSPLNASNLAEVLVAQGKWQAAQAAIDTARLRYPAAVDLYAIPLLELYSNTAPDASRGYADSVRRVANSYTRRFTTVFLADLEARAGRVRNARRLRTEVIREDSAAGRLTETFRRSTPNREEPAAVVMAHLDGILLGDHARATHALDSAGTDDRWSSMALADRPYGSYAITYAQLRRPDKARAMLARMEADLRDTALLRGAQPLVHEALAEIALVERRPDIAISEFRKADVLPDGPIDADPVPILVNLGRAFDVANSADSAIAYFERYLTTPSNRRMADDALYLAGVLRRLAELYEAKGDNAMAATYLRRFVELWKNADPELQPIVSEARRRLDRLERTLPK